MSTKDQSILDLVARLDLPRRGWSVVDHWEADAMAVGIARSTEPRTLVYVSTFNKEPDKYYYECEAAGGNEAHEYITVETGDAANFQQLEAVLNRHLGEASARD